MTLEQIYYISQLISTVALLASVIYLGRQTHLVAKGQFAQMHQARSEQFQEVMLKMTDPDFGPLVTSATHGDVTLTDEQIQRFYFYAVTAIRIFEEMYRQWREGTIADNRWETSKRTLAAIIRSAGYRSCYWAIRASLDKDFASLIDEILAKEPIALALDLPDQWRSGVERAMSNGSTVQNET